MNDEAAFLAHIVANPHDLTARLVFADWLEEQTAPELRDRGAFIRAQFELEELPRWDPQRYPVLARANRLLGQHHTRWKPRFSSSGFEFIYRRGFIEEVRWSAPSVIQQIDELLTLAPIRCVKMWQPPRPGTPHLGEIDPAITAQVFETLSATPRGQAVDEIEFGPDGESFTESKLPTPDAYPWVRSLFLPGGQVPLNALLDSFRELEQFKAAFRSDRAVQELSTIRTPNRLRSLDLSRSGLTQQSGCRHLFQSPVLAHLQTLRLDSSFERFASEATSLVECPFLTQLQQLSLRNNWLREGDCSKILNADRLASVTELDLGDNDIYDHNMKGLADCPGLAKLRVLGLHHNGIRNEGAKALARSPYWTQLEVLNLFDNRIGDEGLRALSRDGAFPRLRSLNLVQNLITGVGLLSLAQSELGAQLEDFSADVQDFRSELWSRWFSRDALQLRRLRLQCRVFTSDDARALAALPFPPSLVELDLSGCSMSGETIQILSRMPQMSQIGLLGLSRNHIDETTVRALASSPHLAQLHTLEIVSYHSNLRDRAYRTLLDSPHLTRLACLRVVPPNRSGAGRLTQELQARFGQFGPAE